MEMELSMPEDSVSIPKEDYELVRNLLTHSGITIEDIKAHQPEKVRPLLILNKKQPSCEHSDVVVSDDGKDWVCKKCNAIVW